MALMITCATIRQALFSVAKMGDPLMYTGLPRTVSGYEVRDGPAGPELVPVS